MSHPYALAIAAVTLALAAAAPAGAEELVPYTVVEGGIPAALTSKPGDPANGRKLAADQDVGGCLSCHEMPMPEEDMQGKVGPNLAGVAERLDAAQLRLRLVDAKKINPETVMPAFYRTEGLNRVAKKLEGKPILTAQQVEDVVAYLRTLK